MIQEELNNLTQSERFAVQLMELRQDITAKDRKLAKTKCKLTPETVSRYLNGKVNDNDTAAKLLSFFKERIAERDKMLA